MHPFLNLKIILQNPPAGIDYGLQKGSGKHYEAIQVQTSLAADLVFNFAINVKGDKEKDSLPNLVGDFVQGPKGGRFVYIDIGLLAGQVNTCWERRLKVPLSGISWDMIQKIKTDKKLLLETRVAGKDKNGCPACATVKPFNGWKLKGAEAPLN